MREQGIFAKWILQDSYWWQQWLSTGGDFFVRLLSKILLITELERLKDPTWGLVENVHEGAQLKRDRLFLRARSYKETERSRLKTRPKARLCGPLKYKTSRTCLFYWFWYFSWLTNFIINVVILVPISFLPILHMASFYWGYTFSLVLFLLWNRWVSFVTISTCKLRLVVFVDG